MIVQQLSEVHGIVRKHTGNFSEITTKPVE